MPSYTAPVADTMFLLTDVFPIHRYENLPRFAEAPIDVVEAILAEGGRFASEVLQPLNLSGDQEAAADAVEQVGARRARPPPLPRSRSRAGSLEAEWPP